MENLSYAEIEQMDDPNKINLAAANVAATAADGTLDNYEAAVTLALLDAKSQEVYDKNAAEIVAYEGYAEQDSDAVYDSVPAAPPTAQPMSFLARIQHYLYDDD